jgi:hypothetical protein
VPPERQLTALQVPELKGTPGARVFRHHVVPVPEQAATADGKEGGATDREATTDDLRRQPERIDHDGKAGAEATQAGWSTAGRRGAEPPPRMPLRIARSRAAQGSLLSPLGRAHLRGAGSVSSTPHQPWQHSRARSAKSACSPSTAMRRARSKAAALHARSSTSAAEASRSSACASSRPRRPLRSLGSYRARRAARCRSAEHGAEAWLP